METQEVTLKILLNWPQSWLVENRDKEPVWLQKRDASRLGNAGSEHAVFRVPLDVVVKLHLK